MSKVEEITFQDLRKWLSGLCASDLSEVEDEVGKAMKRKLDEGRVSLLRVTADGIIVAYFKSEDMAGALNYLLAHEDKGLGEVRIERAKIRQSEVDEHLANRWWPP